MGVTCDLRMPNYSRPVDTLATANASLDRDAIYNLVQLRFLMRIGKLFPTVVLVMLLSACTSQQIYDSLQDNARDECNTMSGPDRATCLDRVSASYDDYKKERNHPAGK